MAACYISVPADVLQSDQRQVFLGNSSHKQASMARPSHMPIVVTMVVAYIAIAGSALNIVDVEAKPNGLEQSSTRTASVSDSMDATVDVARYRRLQQISDEASTTPQDDSIDGRRKKSKCKPIGGSVPSGNYAGHDIDDDDEDKMEDFYDQARRYCDDTRILILGDSIMNHLRYSGSCTRKIYSKYSGKGLNFGISGIGAYTVAKLARWVFEDTCMAPQVVYMAIGVNDCRPGRTGSEAIRGITDAIKIIKHYSPDTHVVVQKVLPTTKPYQTYAGKEWEDQEAYDCVERVNRDVGRWIRDHRSSCISHEDLENVVLKGGKFRKGVYDDGLHFYQDGKMNKYCSKISKAVKKYSKIDVSARGSVLGWVDTEPFTYALKNESFHRWTYNDWSECNGTCSKQLRTANCMLQHPGINSMLEPADEAFCADAFMNPLERICNITDECINDFLENRAPLNKELDILFPEGDQNETIIFILIGVGSALALLCAAFVVYSVRRKEGKAAAKGSSKQPANLKTSDEPCDSSIPALMTSSKAVPTLVAV